jgi:ABC-type uncharacterized transport system permease subunit
VLRKILRQTYHEKENLEVGEHWQLNAMRRIRNLGPLKSKLNYIMLFEQFLWRLTPATCFLVLILLALLLKFDFTPKYDVFTSFISDMEELSLVQLFGV